MTRPPLALVFDLDGTLVDSTSDIAAACNTALAAHGWAPLPVERIAPMIGDGARALVARALAFAASKQEADLDAALVNGVLQTFKARYLASPAVHTTLRPGARDVLAVGIPCGLVTNKPRDVTDVVLDALGIRAAFGAVWGGGDGPLKPSPAGVIDVLGRLGVAPKDAWMVGDGPQDVEAGKAAGCFTVALPGIAARERVLAAAPDLVVESLRDVVRLIVTGA